MRKIFRNVYSNLLCAPAEDVNVGQYGGGNVQGVTSSGTEIDDPNKNTPLEGAVKTIPEDKGGMVQHGQDANASALQEAGLLNNRLYRKILEYHVRKYPFFTAVFSKAQQMGWKGHKEAEYPEIGDIRTEARFIQAYTGSKSGKTLALSGSYLNPNDAAIFRKNYTVFVLGVKGYNEGTTTQNNETLMLYVDAVNDNGYPVVHAINGPAVSSGSSETYVPDIPAGAVLRLGAPALAEEEVEVDPINVIPTMAHAYLQKKGYSVAFTDFFNEAVKEVDWEKDRIRRQALDTYKKLYVTTKLLGVGKKFNKRNKNGVRLCYTEKGAIGYIRNAFELPNGRWTKGALISIAKMLFTIYTDSDEIEVFCGSDAIEGLLNIDWGKDGVSQITYLKDDEYNVDVAKFRCTFGTLVFTHEISLTENHLEKAAIAIPMKDCIRLYRDNGSTHKVDGKKGETGSVEELVKEYFVQDDCFICNALNSMIIGPHELFEQNSGVITGVTDTFIAVESLPTATENNLGKVYYLTKNDPEDNVHGVGLWQVVVTGTSNNTTTYGYAPYSQDKTRA